MRSFRLADGTRLREQLLALSDREHVSTYCILDSDIPLERYVATVRLKPVTDGRRTFWHWESTFATPKGRERELTEQVGRNVYEAGFEALRKYLRAGGERTAATVRDTSSPQPLGQVLAGPAVVLAAHGGVDQLHLTEVEARPPAAGEVRIRQTAIGLNFIDVYVRSGRYASLLEPGGVPGFEAAGTVIDVGTDVTHLLPGDRVAYACLPAGAYASVRTMAADQLVRLPASVGDTEAAAVMLKGMTAEYCLFRLRRMQPDDIVLVHAAAGGLGMLCAQWAAALGARSSARSGSDDKARAAREYCEAVVVRRDGRFAEAVQRLSGGRGATPSSTDLGRTSATRTWRLSRRPATGSASARPADRGARSTPHGCAEVGHAVATGDLPLHAERVRLNEMAQRVFDALEDRTLQPQIARYALTAAAQAHADLEGRRTTGQLVLLA